MKGDEGVNLRQAVANRLTLQLAARTIDQRIPEFIAIDRIKSRTSGNGRPISLGFLFRQGLKQKLIGGNSGNTAAEDNVIGGFSHCADRSTNAHD